MRKVRVWIEADKVYAPGDTVYLKFAEDGAAKFTSDKKTMYGFLGAIFLEKSEGGLTPGPWRNSYRLAPKPPVIAI